MRGFFAFIIIHCLVFLSPQSLANSDLFMRAELFFDSPQQKSDVAELVVSDIAQEESGFIWFATPSGITRYDGYNFRTFQTSTDIKISAVRCIWIAPDGLIWLGTQNDGLYAFNPVSEKFEHFPHHNRAAKTFKNNYIRSITGDGKGGLWVGTSQGLDHLDPKTKKYRHFFPKKGQTHSSQGRKVQSLLLDNKNQLWVGTLNGLRVLNTENFTWRTIAGYKEDLTDKSRLEVRSIVQDKDDNIWIGTSRHGVAWIKPNSDALNWVELDPLYDNDDIKAWITDIALPNDDEVWLATTTQGIYIIDRLTANVIKQIKHDVSVPTSINSDNIDALHVDHSGLVWIGSWGGGLNTYNPLNSAVRNIHHSLIYPFVLHHADVNAILELNNGDILFGNRGNGIDVFQQSGQTYPNFRPTHGQEYRFGDATVLALSQTADDTLWIGTMHAGLYRYNIQTNQQKHYTRADGLIQEHIRTFFIDQDNALWLGTDGGLNRYNARTDTLESFFFAKTQHETFNLSVNAINQTADGTLWVGTFNGLFAMPKGQNELIQITHQPNKLDSLSNNSVGGLLVTSDNALWVATASSLDRLLNWDGKQASFESISRRVRRPNQTLGENLLEDEQGFIWTEDMIINPKTWSVRELTRADGIELGNPWWGSYTKLRDGTLVYGGSKGVALIKPEHFTEWRFTPTPQLSALFINNQAQAIANKEKVLLEPNTQSFSVEFTALDYSSPHIIKYAYKLEGYDTNWININAKHRKITYTNLAPGMYTLQIRATNRIGKWSPSTLRLNVEQKPNWYQLAWVKATFFITTISVIYGLFLIRISALQNRKRQLAAVIKERTLELEQKNNELEQALHALEQRSVTDQLTNTYNRHFVPLNLPNEIAKIQSHYLATFNKHPLKQQPRIGFMLIDADHFKNINDTYGHQTGDQVLQDFARIIQEQCRAIDWVIRWGGEEFLVICRDISDEEIEKQAEKIRLAIADFQFGSQKKYRVAVSCSIGLAFYPFSLSDPRSLTWEQTLNIADLALYHAKNKGRNNCVHVKNNNRAELTSLYSQLQQDFTSAVDNGLVNVVELINTNPQ
ncbi:ligand-binding sensor domain-containing diguanylate cyclase [Algibacillus agarilyticus]|uniref:ligand-binding sensor domain-containing diguanylate cyclase n=1 Tax=Algibacillus agarilyticus TaxID=2234133 RepID=UPI000DD0DDA1|nr:diguanylate cyclase [Algibacillus agarilyticus]